MNNNRNNNSGNNNNRRRGRGNRPQQGGGNQNRVDSRARGNAPQMFEKYRKLAQDAAHNGDRVQAEYYLQFADHYFRVTADNKARQDESRGGGQREFQAEDEGEEDDFDVLRPPQSSGRFNDRQVDRQNDRPSDRPNDGQNYRPNDRQRPPARRDERPRSPEEGEPAYEGGDSNDFEPAQNPFTRGAQNRDSDRPRDNDRPRDGDSGRGRGRRGNYRDANEARPTGDAGEIDAAALPPSFSNGADVADDSGSEAVSTKRKLPPRRRRTAAGDPADDGETLKAAG